MKQGTLDLYSMLKECVIKILEEGKIMKREKWRKSAFFLLLIMLLSICPVSVRADTIKLGNSFVNQLLGSRSAEYHNRIYYGISQRIYSIKKDGTGKKLVMDMKDGSNGFYNVAVYDGYIYALYDYYGGSDSSDCQLLKIKLNGTGYKNLGRVNDFAITDGKIYCTKTKHISAASSNDTTYNEVHGLYSMNLNGTSAKKLVSGKNIVFYGTDGKMLYYGNRNWNTGNTAVYTCNMKGNSKKKIKTVNGMEGIFFDQNSVYYQKADSEDNYKQDIYQVNMTTEKEKVIYKASGWVSSFYVKNHILYISTDNGLQKINLNTGKKESVNKQVKNGIRGIHGSVIVGERFRMDMKAGTDYDVFMITSSGKMIKRIGAYFVS